MRIFGTRGNRSLYHNLGLYYLLLNLNPNDQRPDYGILQEVDTIAETSVPSIPRFPPSHRGRGEFPLLFWWLILNNLFIYLFTDRFLAALHEMRNAILVRKSICFEVRLKTLLCGTNLDEMRKEISLQRKKRAKSLIRKMGAWSEKAGVPKETGQKIEMEGERYSSDITARAFHSLNTHK